MKTLDSQIILPNGKVYDCKYYDIENIAKKIIEEYTLESDENNQKFIEFTKPYQYFHPYLDFLLIELKACITNYMLDEGKILFAKGDELYIKGSDINGEVFTSTKSDDDTLNIRPMGMDSSYFSDCVVDAFANQIKPDKMFGHIQIISQILNLLLISNEEVARTYLEDYKVEMGYFLSRFYPFIRFQADMEGNRFITRCLYREENKTEAMQEFMELLLLNRYTYPSFLLTVEDVDKYSSPSDMSNYLKYRDGNNLKK